MLFSYTTDDPGMIKALKDPFVKVGHELLDLLIKIDKFSQDPAIPYDQID
ncbi:MAG: hypothetical protein HYY61_06090, partial [Deltaproteobacteria bacterium]|nr:hypothetical protein [Deltaproteobacteria bacterium]